MVYIAIGIVGLVAVVIGVVVGALGYELGGSIVGASGGFLTAVGLIGFGAAKRRESRLSGLGRDAAPTGDLTELLDDLTRLLVERGFGRSRDACDPAAARPRPRIGREKFEAAIKSAFPNLVNEMMKRQRQKGQTPLTPEELSRYGEETKQKAEAIAVGLRRLQEAGIEADRLAAIAATGPDRVLDEIRVTLGE